MSLMAAGDDGSVSRSEFARRLGVAPSRVNALIDTGKIDGDALVGRRINPEIAAKQVGDRVRPRRKPEQVEKNLGGRPPNPDKPLVESIAAQINRAKLEEQRRKNREGAREEAAAAGLLTDTAAVRRIMGQETAKLVAELEGSLAEIASRMAAEFKLPARDALHFLRKAFREVRAAQADRIATRAKETPERVEVELPDSDL